MSRSPIPRRLLGLLGSFALLGVGAARALPSSPPPGRLLQEEDRSQGLAKKQKLLLDRAKRLRRMMQDLRQRYQKEGREDYVRLLTEALGYMEEKDFLKGLNQAWGALDAGKISRALASQAEVLSHVECLLSILLDRRSVADLEKDADRVEAMLEDLDRLRRRNRDLRKRVEDLREEAKSAAERKIEEELRSLAEAVRTEARKNIGLSSARQDHLERALEGVRELQTRKAELDARLQELARPPREEGEDTISRIRELIRGTSANLEGLQGLQEVEALLDHLEVLAARAGGGRIGPGDLRKAKSLLAQARHRMSPPPASGGRPGEAPRLLEALEAEVSDLLEEGRASEEESGKLDPRALGKARTAAKDHARARNEALEASNRDLSTRTRSLSQELEAKGREAGARPEGEEASRRFQERRRRRLDRETAGLLDEASRKLMESARELRRSRRDPRIPGKGAKQKAQEALTRLLQALDRQEQKNPSPGSLAHEIERKADELSKEVARVALPGGKAREAAQALEEASRAMSGARERMARRRAGGSPPGEEGKALERETREARARTGEALARARQSLESEIGKLRRESARKASGARTRQESLEGRLRDMESRIREATRRGDLDPTQNKAMAPELRKGREAMQGAGKDLRQGSPRAAARKQSEAARNLEEAARRMRDARRMGEAQQEELSRLAERQRELELDILELAKRIDEKKNPEARKALDRAREAASKAGRSMQEGEPQATEQAQKETQEALDEARKELQKERDRYLRLRQEELLFKIADEVRLLLDRQSQINRQTLTLVSGREAEARLPRPIRSQLRQLGRREKELETRAREIADRLREEGTLVFTYVLESIAQDLDELAGNLGSRNPRAGRYTQGLQGEVVAQLKWLLAALKEEIRRKRRERENEPEDREGNSNQGDRKRRLVPDLAELKLLRRLEVDVRNRIEDFLELRKELGKGFAEIEQRRLNRLALRHAKVSDLFKEFVETRGLLGRNPHGTDPGEEETGKEKKDG